MKITNVIYRSPNETLIKLKVQALHFKSCDTLCTNIWFFFFSKTQWNVQLKPLVALQWNLWSWILSPLLLIHRDRMKHSSDLRNKISTVKWHRNHTCTYLCTQVTFLPSCGEGSRVSEATVSKLRRFFPHIHVAQIQSYFLNRSVWSKQSN